MNERAEKLEKWSMDPRFKQFASLEDALRVGYSVQMGDGFYAKGGVELTGHDYPELFAALSEVVKPA